MCATCWHGVEFIQEPSCDKCGVPFKFDIGAKLICGACLKKPPHFDKAVSLFRYDEHSGYLIHKLKYNDKTYMSKYFASWIVSRVGSQDIQKYNYITCVPMHRKRLRQRFYNQSALIAKALAKTLGMEFMPNLLIKARYDSPQTKLTRNKRIKNVKNSFSINEKYKTLLPKKSIIIIDDVYTTGSTLNECSKVLRKSGCSEIKAITLARVCRVE